ncbi:hypothetical protein PhCBS80983_g05698 [Powellomyces hirtus]|uniref:Sas10 C-terminal domain-containing protein n=1 Tax=Powellomyces hirtus TaxID=109895 RepID=A0A507DVD8_9FUNG|nr:hypothetical protein PhCBS80983_g05698 [Powellomyces hirtus]
MARKKHGRKSLERPQTAAQDEVDYSKNASANLDNIGLDSEDEFHHQRESIALDSYNKTKPRRRRGQVDSDDEADEEVFGLGIEDSEDEQDSEAFEDEDDDGEEDQDEALLKKLQMQLKRGGAVVGDSDDDDDDEALNSKTKKKRAGEDDEMDDRAWGNSRNMYYNADEASDEDDAKAEEEEALRLQRLRTSQMREEDFLDEFEDSFGKRIGGDAGATGSQSATPLTDDVDDLDHLALSSAFPLNLLPSAQTEVEVVSRETSNLSPAELIKVAESSIPEVVHLLAEFKERWQECREILGPAVAWKCHAEEASASASRGRAYVELKFRLLSTYLTNVAFYLSLRANPPAGVNVTGHPVVDSLVQLRELLEHLETRVEGRVLSDDDDDESEADSDQDAAAKKRRRKRKRKEKKIAARGNPELQAAVQAFLDRGPLDLEHENENHSDRDEEEASNDSVPEIMVPPKSTTKKNKKSSPSTATTTSSTSPSSASAVNAKTKKKTAAVAAALNDSEVPEMEYVPLAKLKKSKTTKAKIARGMAHDFGETDDLDAADLDDKLQRKKSLKFHVTRVDQAITARHNRLSRSAGGDEDIPYRDKNGQLILPSGNEPRGPSPEKVFDAPDDLENNSDNHSEVDEDELMQELMNAGGLGGGAGGGRKRAREDHDDMDVLSDGGDQDLAYYNTITNAKKSKTKEHEDRVRAEKEADALVNSQPYPDEDEIDSHTKRPATYKILANKGLTPHRSKEQRNPRVKKRMNYERAQKKLGSFKRLVKNPADARGYAGEKTGIKSNLARSVRFAA